MFALPANMKQKFSTPKDAAAVILLNGETGEVLWARRNRQLRFLGGFHGFVGGKVESDDAEVKVKNCADNETAQLITCAARELFEETSVLLVRKGEKLTKGQLASLHDDLISGRMTFSEILAHWGLYVDAEDFIYTGFWTTPEFSPIRFKTHFFLAVCPAKQTPHMATRELENVEFIKPSKAFELWEKSKVLIAPPVLTALKELAEQENLITDERGFKKIKADVKLKVVAENLLEKSQVCAGNINYIELNSRLICVPLATETLPPATHTNCFIVGKQEFVVIDAASKDENEQRKLHDLIDSFIEKGFVCQAIIVTHLHKDHFGGETVLQNHLREKFNLKVPISAHELTAESLRGKVNFDRFIEDEEIFKLKNENGKTFDLTALHTPGHARGQLCFYDEKFGFLLSGDNVLSFGSVVIALPEGNMTDYLASLERLKNLPNLNFLCGSHGAAVLDAKGKIEEYIAHRLERERQILEAFENGAKTLPEIVEQVYPKLNPKLLKLAEKSVEAHLEKLQKNSKSSGRISDALNLF